MIRFTIISLLICEGLTKAVLPASDLTNLISEHQKNMKTGDRSESYFKTLAILGILQGTVNVEKRMQQNTLRSLVNIKDQYQKNNFKGVEKRLKKLAVSMQRDNKALEILQNTLRASTSLNKKVRTPVDVKKNQTTLEAASLKDFEKIEEIILDQLKMTHSKVNATVYEIVNKMESSRKQKLNIESSTPLTITSSVASTHKTAITDHDRNHFQPVYVHMAAPGWSSLYQVDDDGFVRFRRQNEGNVGVENGDKTENQVDAKESTEFEYDFPAPATDGAGGGGGITSLIASLSGGEGGSDVGALVGAISGVVTTLFGPGGLDVPTLISSGTSLITGLLSGNENFGKVLASYVGLALEGFTGGGGADLNGEFFGQFVGTFLGELSADPEEEAGPMPMIFIENFHKGFEQTKQKRGADNMTTSHQSHKGYFLEFISNIVSSLAGGITNLILNSSVGASGGSSQASADLSAGSSQGSHTGSASASQTSSGSHQPQHQPQALKVKKM